MRRKIVAIAVAIPVLYLVLFAVQVGIAYTHAQSYAQQLAGEYDKKQKREVLVEFWALLPLSN